MGDERGRQLSVQHVSVHMGKCDYAHGPLIVSDIVGLLWWVGEDGCCIVHHTCLACLMDLQHSTAHLLIAFD